MGRRAKGEGSWTTRPDGRLQYRWTQEGKRHTVTGASRTECLTKAKELRKALEQGALAASPKLTVETWFTDWLVDIKHKRPLNTSRTYTWAVHGHIIPTLGTLRLLYVRPDHIRRWRRALDASKLAPKSVEVIHAVLSKGLQDAYADMVLPWNPARRVPNTGADDPDVQPFTREQVAKILAHVRGTRDEALYDLAVTMCMRQGELLGLRWADLELDKPRPTIAIRHQAQHGEITKLKRRRDQITWPLPPRLVPLLKAQGS